MTLGLALPRGQTVDRHVDESAALHAAGTSLHRGESHGVAGMGFATDGNEDGHDDHLPA
jgi:hypothetical protein